MIPVRGDVRVWLASGVTDMRRGMNTLALQVQEALGRDPHAGDLFVFRGRRGDLLKILWHDGGGDVALRQAAGARALRLAVGAGGVGRDLFGAACLHAGRDRLAPSENDLATAQRGLSLRQIDSGGRTGLAGRRGFWFTPAHDVLRPQPRRRDRRLARCVGRGTGGPDTGGSRDRTSEAADREVASRAVRPVLGTGPPPSGSAGTAAGGDGDSGGRECEPGRSRRRRYHGARLHPPQAQAGAAAGRPAARAGRAALARGLPLLWWCGSGQAGGRRHGDAGGGAQAVEGGADGAGEVQLPGLRGHHPAAGAAPCHRARARRPEPAGDDRLRQVRHAPAAHPAEPSLRGRGHRARRLDAG